MESFTTTNGTSTTTTTSNTSSNKVNSTTNNNNKRQHPSNLSSSSTSSIDSSISYNHHHNNQNHHHHHPHINKNMHSNNINNHHVIHELQHQNKIIQNRELSSRNSFPDLNNVSFSSSASGSIQSNNMNNHNDDNECSLTQAGLEEYSRSYYDHHPIVFNHQKQSSYAQSEGYHSYVSSSDSSSTPFLDRLRQDSEVLLSRASQWSQEIQASIPATNIVSDNNSSESTSSTETLKWHGSMSDVSVASHATNSSIISGSGSSQLIAHSSRVRTPKRHNSESVLYMADDQMSVHSSQSGSTDTLNIHNDSNCRNSRSNRNNHRLFPVSTYTETSPTSPPLENGNNITSNGIKIQTNHNWQSVAERINELERQYSSSNQNQKYTYLDPSKTHRVSNPSLKAFQKNAVKSYFQRQQSFKGQSSNNINGVTTRNSPVNGNGNHAARPQSLQLNDLQSNKNSVRASLPNFGSINNISMNMKSPYISPPSQTISQCSNTSSSSNMISPNKSSNKHPSSPLSPYSLNESQKNLLNSRASVPVSPNSNLLNENPPPPPPRTRLIIPTRRTSSASEYASSREQLILRSKQNLSKDLLGPMIMGPIISVDDWVPERPPKNPLLRIPSPDLPPPPLTPIELEAQLLNQDEPLPPPPPEVYRHTRQSSEIEEKVNTTSRRNSFAGSTNKKPLYRASTFENLSPPIIAKKPTPVIIKNNNNHNNIINNNSNVINNHNMNIIAQRPSSSFAKQHAQKAHKILLNNNKNEPPTTNGLIPARMTDSRISLRKRTHNSQTTIELAPMKGVVTPPPPLKPRMSLFSNDKFGIGNKTSLKSSSYHPRHAFEKQQSQIDPDQGIYKKTISMNEDYCTTNNHVNQIPEEEILQTPISNLPDVLPDGAKTQQSRLSSNIINNNNISNINLSQPTTPLCSNNSVFQFQTDTSSNNILNNNKNQTKESQGDTSPKSLDNSSPKYTSESTIDLKKTKILETKIMKNLENDFININRQLSEPPLSKQNIKFEMDRKLSVENYINNNIINNNVNNMEDDHNLSEKTYQADRPEKITSSTTSLNSNNSISSNSHDSLESINSINSSNERLTNEQQDEIINQLTEISLNETNYLRNINNNINNEINNTTVKMLSEITIPAISCKQNEADELKLLQKTEIILRVNALTSEAASQTEDILIPDNSSFNFEMDDSKNKMNKTMLTPRQKLPEEIECDNISKELINHLSPSDKLYNILAPPVQKSTSDYVSGLYNANIPCRPARKDASTTTLEIFIDNHVQSPNFVSTTNSTFFNITETKSKIIPRYSREMTLLNGDSCELMKKKEELLNRLNKKLTVLGNEQTIISEEIISNDNLGHTITIKVSQKLKPSDSSKLRSYIDDIGHITMLLLSLSSRLARVENSIHCFAEGSTEKKMLEVKKDRLIEQLDEAKRLKEDINRRGILISTILEKHLNNDELSDYDYFINMKAKLLVDSKEISDKIKLGEEQLVALKDTMVHSEC